ncbi:MAG: ABC transporter permease, partial [Clostridia bacterium]|nr:ABC transporter permease [Clostridia bacterium]
VTHDKNAVYSDNSQLEAVSKMSTSFTKNNLTDFKKYLDNPESKIHQYVGDNGIVYSYATKFDVYSYDSNDTLVNADGSTLKDQKDQTITFGGMEFGTTDGAMAMIGGGTSLFEEILPDPDTKTISNAVKENYDLIYGEYPTAYNELVMILDENNELPVTALYQLGFLPVDEYKEISKKIEKGEETKIPEHKLSYSDICTKEFYLMPDCDYFVKNRFGTYDNISSDNEQIKKKLEKAVVLKVTGIICQKDDSDNMLIQEPMGYTKLLTDYLMEYTDNSTIVKAQKANEDINVISGMAFEPKSDSEKVKDTKKYIQKLGISDKANMYMSLMASMALSGNIPETSVPSEVSMTPEQIAQMQAAAQQKAQSAPTTEEGMAKAFDEYMKNPDDETLISIYDRYISTGSYEDNLSKMGVVSEDAPSSISIYADSFENKDFISQCIENYNKTVEEENKITYTDYVGLLMSSVTTIINVISYVLIAFVAVSLVVSSIMIGIITYISVLERTKEIGILRAIGASKRNISQVFNAETFIIGLFSGLMGIGITLLLLIPINEIIHAIADNTSINAVLPLNGAVILIVLSVILTLIGGLIPSKKAAKKDPVTALRTE